MFLIVDTFNTLYASYYVFRDKLTGTTPGNAALYGFFHILLARLRALPHYTHVFLCFDQGRSFRYDLFPEYKAHRKYKDDQDRIEKEAIRDGIYQAVDELRELSHFMPWFHVERANTEADDLIAKLCLHYPTTPKQILSSDKDVLQLINTYTTVFNRDKEISTFTFPEQVSIKYVRTLNKQKTTIKAHFLNPDWWFLYRVLTGDVTDGIPGVPGIGEKTGHDIVKVLFERYGGRVANLLNNPLGVLSAAGISKGRAIKIASTLSDEGAKIISRNIRLMSLVEAADHITDIEQCASTGSWFVGKSHLLATFQQKQWPSLVPELHLFEEMANKRDGVIPT